MNKYALVIIAAVIALGAAAALFKPPLPNFAQPDTSQPTHAPFAPKTITAGAKTAVFAGGCFWSLESYFQKMPNEGILDVVSGYSGGTIPNPTYDTYSKASHKEVVQVTYDPTKVSYGELTEYFFRHIDPTDDGGSFFDRGENYSSVVYYKTDEEKVIAQEIIQLIDNAKIFESPIVTEVLPEAEFWAAEGYHQDYSDKNAAHYTGYRIGSGRDAFLKRYWEGRDGLLYME